jgi:hypothetical protein
MCTDINRSSVATEVYCTAHVNTLPGKPLEGSPALASCVSVQWSNTPLRLEGRWLICARAAMPAAMLHLAALLLMLMSTVSQATDSTRSSPLTSLAADAAAAAAATVAVIINQTGFEPRATAIADRLRASGVSVELVPSSAFCTLAPKTTSFVVVPSTPSLFAPSGDGGSASCHGVIDALVRLATGHVGLALLGGWPGRLNLTKSLMQLAVMSPYEPYQLAQYNATTVRVLPQQLQGDPGRASAHSNAERNKPIVLDTPLGGVSAVGWVNPPESWFLPIVDVVDAYNRTVAWALSAVLHTTKGSTFEVSQHRAHLCVSIDTLTPIKIFEFASHSSSSTIDSFLKANICSKAAQP